jgi:hypothetical protein
MKAIEIKEEIEEMDEEVLYTIIQCCKELYCDGIPLFNWNRETLLERFDKAIE